MPPEISPLKFRSVIMAVSTLAMSLFGFLVVKMYDSMQGVLGLYGLYWFYSGVTFLSIIFGVFVLPETKGMSLQDIQDAMAG
ncbi:hypothetical protein JTE90_017621 [Oedothorax gibbosus]|uniref:Major facilitator superfamily (MFS) profile domain-containing protein n=1 Tax=Oedothorax gibbosus TaxID=931172 RepID=A0AAV6U524_9ARAC|nr:hypothetical protein JTE90_017621 [Oedothorax gibbosus]